ncbi:glycosyltransferase family 2 protein [Methanothrix soehngenii]|uniref:glycosyltransferase family 2 protein n=1 Tax=Methanothrix soehngenii TaxID=2223 RepID=UPI0023527ADB|nr:glycosyltransferase family A protein [Methanothrix soehngenii]
MSDIPAISVVIPLYNKESHIARALSSVLNQTFQDFEVIVIDDGSTDGGAEVVRGFRDPRILLIQQENMGVSAARNKGIQLAIADYIAFLDADDEWMSCFLEDVNDMIKKYPFAGAYSTTYRILEANNMIKIPQNAAVPRSSESIIIPNYFEIISRGDPPVCSSSICVPKDVFLKIGGFLEGKDMGEDIDMWFRIALEYQFAFIHKIGAIYYRNASNRACRTSKILTNDFPIIKTAKLAIAGGQVSKKNSEFIKKFVTKIEINTAAANILAGRSKIARQIIMNSEYKYYKFSKCKLIILSIIPHKIVSNLANIKRTYINI